MNASRLLQNLSNVASSRQNAVCLTRCLRECGDLPRGRSKAWAALFTALALAAAPGHVKAVDSLALIPLPQKLDPSAGVFRLKSGTKILVDPSARETGDYL